MTESRATPRLQAGLSMVELMVAITLGLMIAAGLAVLFSNASSNQHEVRRTAQQIENGRYAMEVLMQDLQLAGYYGEFRPKQAAAALPDPCSFALADLEGAMRVPVHGYHAAMLTAQPALPGTCAAWLPAANLSPGSDILVVRRAETTIVPIGTTTTAGMKYIQSSPGSMELQEGGGVTSCTSKANGTPTSVTRRCQFPAGTDMCVAECGIGTSPAGYVRRLRVHVYFVAPCNVPSAGTTCTASSDNGRPIPTLKRLDLTAVGGLTGFEVVPIAEGVELMKIAYGVDDAPNAVNTETGKIGDGAPDRYVLDSASPVDFDNVVTVRVDLLVRNPEPSAGHADTKTYQLSVDPLAPTSPGLTITPADLDPSYRRHAYGAEVRLVNLSGRKETP